MAGKMGIIAVGIKTELATPISTGPATTNSIASSLVFSYPNLYWIGRNIPIQIDVYKRQVRMLLNCPDGQPEEIYAYIGWLFLVYQKFEVKYEGYQDLWAAIQTGLAPTAPRTILWMNQEIKKQFPYRFDVFDPRYDILARCV